MLSKEIIKEAHEGLLRAHKIEAEGLQRIDYIVDKIFELFNISGRGSRERWRFLASENGFTDFWAAKNEEEMYIWIDTDSYLDEMKIILNHREFDFRGGIFPTRWLWEDFEEEIIAGKKKYDQTRIMR